MIVMMRIISSSDLSWASRYQPQLFGTTSVVALIFPRIFWHEYKFMIVTVKAFF